MSYNLIIPEATERVLPTLERDGRRRWLFPRLSKGRFWHQRRAVAYALLALYALIPFLRIGGRPVLLLDVMHRRFTILGVTFLPTDTLFLALLLLTWLVGIFLVTALLGRVWCGWVCPQTVYLEYVFRPIERLFTGRSGRGGAPAADVPGWRKVAMYATYAVVCLHLSNTFLAYFVPAPTLNKWIMGSPANHPAGFAIVAFITIAMLGNFAWFREQTCAIACPYGRLQSVLLDRRSLIVGYDERRGEPRGRRTSLSVLKTASDPAGVGVGADAGRKGDCVDCSMCVQVCPAGIDIRDGLQVECVACTQCIDACDAVMDKIDRPRGLIRYTSQAALAGEPSGLLRARPLIYSAIVLVLLGVLTALLMTRSPADVTVLRGVGRPFVVNPDGVVENTLKVKITNRTDEPRSYRVAAAADRNAAGVEVRPEREAVTVNPGESVTEPVRVLAPAGRFLLGKFDATLRVTDDAGDVRIDRTCRLLGPSTGVATQATTQPQTLNAGASDERR